MGFDVKGLIAVMVIGGSFTLLGIYVFRGQVPDATVVAFVALPLGAVIGFYFGHINGAATALANNATALAGAALTAAAQRRTTDAGTPTLTPPIAGVVVVPADPAPPATAVPPGAQGAH